jgi:hypothetical protein
MYNWLVFFTMYVSKLKLFSICMFWTDSPHLLKKVVSFVNFPLHKLCCDNWVWLLIASYHESEVLLLHIYSAFWHEGFTGYCTYWVDELVGVSWAKSQTPFAIQLQFLPFVTFKHWNYEIMKFLELCTDMIKCSSPKVLGTGIN